MSESRRWNEPVAVSGMGVITPYGRGVAAFKQALYEGRSAIGSASLAPLEGSRPVGLLASQSPGEWIEPFISGEHQKGKILKKVLRRKPLPVVLSALAALEAFESADLEKDNPGQMGIVVGGHSLASSYDFEMRRKFDVSPNHVAPSFLIQLLDTDHVGVLSELLGIHGTGLTVGGASASGQMAIIQAANLIRLEEVDRCLVIGPLADLNPMAIQSLDAMGALGGHEYSGKPTLASRPFDQARSGFIFSQACGALILESVSSCKGRRSPMIGFIAGSGVHLDGTALPSPSSRGEQNAMTRALGAAGLTPDEVDTLNAHGTASHAGDIAELEAIASVFGAHAKSLKVQSTKGLLGHTLWAAGVVEAIALLIQMGSGFIHPNANLKNPIRTDIGFAGRHTSQGGPSIALSNSFGFGGINTSLVVMKDWERKTL